MICLMAQHSAPKRSKSQRVRLGCVTNVFCSLDQQVIRGKIQALAHNISYPEEEAYHHHYKLYQPSNIFCLPPNLISIKSCINCTTCRSHSSSQVQNQKDLKSLHPFILHQNSSFVSIVCLWFHLLILLKRKKNSCLHVCRVLEILGQSRWGKCQKENSFCLTIFFGKHNNFFSYLYRNLRKSVICSFFYKNCLITVLNVLLERDT